MALQAEGLLSASSNRISNAANLCALLYQELADVSWVGFYFLDEKKLMVGPFQGKPACVSIELGKGLPFFNQLKSLPAEQNGAGFPFAYDV